MRSYRRAWADFDRATDKCREINPTRYRHLLLRAASGGSPLAMRTLIMGYARSDEGFRRSIRRRNHWFRRLTVSATNGNALSARLLGEHYRSTIPPWSFFPARCNLKRAKHWRAVAMRRGDWDCISPTAQGFDQTGQAEIDYQRAMTHSDQRYRLLLLTRAAESDHCGAIEALMTAYHSGTDGVLKNPRMRAYWERRLRQAAARGNTQAQFEVGARQMYVKPKRGYEWLSKAAHGGHPEAAMKLALHAKELGVSEAEEQVWLYRALELRDVDALAIFSRRLWRNGRPAPPQIELWKEMARKGHSQAQEQLDHMFRRQHTDRKPSRVRR